MDTKLITAELKGQILEWCRHYSGMSLHIPVQVVMERARLAGAEDDATARAITELIRSRLLRRTWQVHPDRGEDVRNDNTGHLKAVQRGRGRLSRTDQLNLRVPHSLRQALDANVGRMGDSAGSVAVRALEEWSSMQAFPGIDYRWGPAGRRACIKGTGLSVGEICRIWMEHGRDEKRVMKNFPLSLYQIRGAVAFAEAHAEELAGPWGTRPPGIPVVEA